MQTPVINHLTGLESIGSRHSGTLDEWLTFGGPDFTAWFAACNSTRNNWGTRCAFGMNGSILRLAALITLAAYDGIDQNDRGRRQQHRSITLDVMDPQLVDLDWLVQSAVYEAFVIGPPGSWALNVPLDLAPFCDSDLQLPYTGEAPIDGFVGFQIPATMPPPGLTHFTAVRNIGAGPNSTLQAWVESQGSQYRSWISACNSKNPPWGTRCIVAMMESTLELVGLVTFAEHDGIQQTGRRAQGPRNIRIDVLYPELVDLEMIMQSVFIEASILGMPGNWEVDVPPQMAEFVAESGLPYLGEVPNGMDRFLINARA